MPQFHTKIPLTSTPKTEKIWCGTERFLVWNWGIFGAEKEWPFCVEQFNLNWCVELRAVELRGTLSYCIVWWLGRVFQRKAHFPRRCWKRHENILPESSTIEKNVLSLLKGQGCSRGTKIEMLQRQRGR